MRNEDSDGTGVRSRLAFVRDVGRSRGFGGWENADANDRCLEGISVVVVDDAPDELEMMRYVFELYGASVKTAESADEALHAICEEEPDVLVSDVSLADRDGYSLVRELRRSASHDIPAVAVTGWDGERERAASIAAGFQVHLTKPVAVSTLVGVVASLARAYRARSFIPTRSRR